jgi:hypothetical protein
MADTTTDSSRRAFVKKAAYVAPLILTLKAAPALASPGSDKDDQDKQSVKGKR